MAERHRLGQGPWRHVGLRAGEMAGQTEHILEELTPNYADRQYGEVLP